MEMETNKIYYKLIVSLDNSDRNIFKQYFDFIEEYFLYSAIECEKLGLYSETKEIIKIGSFDFENNEDYLGFCFTMIHSENLSEAEITEQIKGKLPREVKLILEINKDGQI